MKAGNNNIDIAKLEKASDILKSIAHPVRLKVIDLLQAGSLTVTELMRATGVEQSLLSHHLTKMKDKGVLQSARQGKNIRYSLTDNKIITVFDCLDSCSFMN